MWQVVKIDVSTAHYNEELRFRDQGDDRNEKCQGGWWSAGGKTWLDRTAQDLRVVQGRQILLLGLRLSYARRLTTDVTQVDGRRGYLLSIDKYLSPQETGCSNDGSG
jgi:hypothetical protein